jgi:hypothetical protein
MPEHHTRASNHSACLCGKGGSQVIPRNRIIAGYGDDSDPSSASASLMIFTGCPGQLAFSTSVL